MQKELKWHTHEIARELEGLMLVTRGCDRGPRDKYSSASSREKLTVDIWARSHFKVNGIWYTSHPQLALVLMIFGHAIVVLEPTTWLNEICFAWFIDTKKPPMRPCDTAKWVFWRATHCELGLVLTQRRGRPIMRDHMSTRATCYLEVYHKVQLHFLDNIWPR